MAASLPNDVLFEILVRLDDAADLFRCATACKRWRGLVTDASFLLRQWPEHVRPSLAGLFIKNRGRYQGSKVLVPTPWSELGPGRRALGSFVPGVSARLLYHAVPLFSSRGLLLARLVPKHSNWSVVHLAVCNLLTGTCDVLLPIQLGHASLSPASPAGERSGCAIVTGTDCRSSGDDEEPRGNSPLFKVIIITVSCKDDLKFYLNTFSSDEPTCWSAMRTVSFGATIDAGASGSFCQSDAVMRHGTAHWLFRNETARCFCLVEVNAQNGHVAFTRLPIPMMIEVDYPCLSSATDGTLSALQMQGEGSQLAIWKRQEDQQSVGTASEWLRTRTIELIIMQPRKENQGREWLYMVGEKCGKLIVKDRRGRVYTGNLSTGAMEEVADWPRMCHISTPNVVPLEMDWLAFFVSRLGTISNLAFPSHPQVGREVQEEEGDAAEEAAGKLVTVARRKMD